MKRLSVVNKDKQKDIYPIKFITCKGDELDLCDSCKIRFSCYTGELPSEFSTGINPFAEEVESRVFGSSNGVMEYDYFAHNAYYDQDWHKQGVT